MHCGKALLSGLLVKHFSLHWLLGALGREKERGSEVAKTVRSMSGFPGSSRAMACRETGQRGWLKVVLLLWSGTSGRGGNEVQGEHKEVRGSRGTGNNEEESLIHFLGLAFGL